MADKLIKKLAKLHEDISWEDDDDDTFEEKPLSSLLNSKKGYVLVTDYGYHAHYYRSIASAIDDMFEYYYDSVSFLKTILYLKNEDNGETVFEFNLDNGSHRFKFNIDYINELNNKLSGRKLYYTRKCASTPHSLTIKDLNDLEVPNIEIAMNYAYNDWIRGSEVTDFYIYYNEDSMLKEKNSYIVCHGKPFREIVYSYPFLDGDVK